MENTVKSSSSSGSSFARPRGKVSVSCTISSSPVSRFFLSSVVLLAILDIIQHYESFAAHPFLMLLHAALEALVSGATLTLVTICLPESIKWIIGLLCVIPYFLRQLATHPQQLRLIAQDIDRICGAFHLDHIELPFNVTDPLPSMH